MKSIKTSIIFIIFLIVIAFYGHQQGLIVLPSLDQLGNLENTSESAGQKEESKPEVQSKKPLQLSSEEEIITSVIEETLPSVVTIEISTTSQSPGSLQIDPSNPFSPFRRIPGEERQIERNIGSGFIVSADGFIVTNKHVVSSRDAEYTVITSDGERYEVINVSRDPLNDLAIIKIQASGLQPLELGDSDQIKLGQSVIAIGTPLGEFTNTVTTGIVSGLGRGIVAGSFLEGHVERLDNVIQTDAAINPGNSGGPLISTEGLVIGVNTAVSGEGQNIGFAIPANVVADLLDNFNAAGGVIERPFIGIRYQMISQEAAVLNELPQGALISEVIAESPAEVSGIEQGDIITEFDGTRLTGEPDALQSLIAEKSVGDTVAISLWRDGETRNITLTLGTFE